MKKISNYIKNSSQDRYELEKEETIKIRTLSDYDVRQIVMDQFRKAPGIMKLAETLNVSAQFLRTYIEIPDSAMPRFSSHKGYEKICEIAGVSPYIYAKHINLFGVRGVGPDEKYGEMYFHLDTFLGTNCELDQDAVISLEELYRAYVMTVQDRSDLLYRDKFSFMGALRLYYNLQREKYVYRTNVNLIRGIRFNKNAMEKFHYWEYNVTNEPKDKISFDDLVHIFVSRYCEVGVQYNVKSENLNKEWASFLDTMETKYSLPTSKYLKITKVLNRYSEWNIVCVSKKFYGIRIKFHPNTRDPYGINTDMMPKKYADALIEWRAQHPRVLRNFVDEKKQTS